MAEREPDRKVEQIRTRLAELEAEQASLRRQLTGLLQTAQSMPPMPAEIGGVTVNSGATDKIKLFRRLFAGRHDVFPIRWQNTKTGRSGYAPACANEWVKGICGKPQVKCGECPNQAFIRVSDDVIERHLRGEHSTQRLGADFVAGVYPLLPDETCWFLAADFDGESWAADALAYMQTCRAKDAPAALERSRSG